MSLPRRRRLQANPTTTRRWQQRSRQGSRLTNDERAVREAVFRRAGFRCELGALDRTNCWGDLTYHHRRKAGASGSYTIANGACLCLGHNLMAEDEPARVREMAPRMIVREGDPEWDHLGVRWQRLNGDPDGQ